MSTLGPRSAHSASASGFTLVGCLDSPEPPRLDAGGLLQPGGSRWSLDWWIGADDRWYFPSREASVRQSRIGSGPVIETMMRVPSGDVVHTCYGISTPSGELTVIEIENRSPVPVALALAVRPYGLDGSESAPRIEISETEVHIDSRFAVGLAKPPNDLEASERDLADVVVNGEALDGVRSADGPGSNSVLLYPLPHTTSLRFVVAGSGYEGPFSGEIPDAASVARGWDSVVGAGGRLELPDPGITAAAASSRSRLLAVEGLADRIAKLEPGTGRHLEALALSGARTEVEMLMATFAQQFPRKLKVTALDAALVVAGVGRGSMLVDDPGLLNPALESAAQVTSLVEKSGDAEATSLALGGLARLAARLGQAEAATDLWARAGASSGRGTPTDLARLAALSESASEAGSWGQDEADAAARYWIGLRNQVIRESHSADGERLELVPVYPSSWRGGNLEAIRMPTDFGSISFAIRWHGYRPALLWEKESDIVLTCPGLDKSWSTTELKGETLLSGSRSDLPGRPAEGESFA